MPLFFGIVEDSCKKDVVNNLIKSINENNKALTAGDIGYRYLLRVLEAEGCSQLIYEMNSRNDLPGYGYQLSNGATALTESWAALKYVSNNHMMLGHLMEWFYSGIGGIRQPRGSNSYESILIYPEVVGDLTWAQTKIQSVHGEILSSWKLDDGNFILKVKIPVNCKATVVIPQADASKVMERNKFIAELKEITNIMAVDGKTRFDILSGEYLFRTSYIRKN